MKIKTLWQWKEWVEDSITEEQKDRDLSWSEIHYDKFGKEYDELHKREYIKLVKYEDVESLVKSLAEILITRFGFDDQIENARKYALIILNKEKNQTEVNENI